MGNVEIVLNHAAIDALLKSNEVTQVCEREAQRMTRATGMDYESDVYVGRTRVNAGGYKEATDD